MTDQESGSEELPVSEQSIIDKYYEGDGCEESILARPLPFRPAELPLHFRPLQETSGMMALDENVIVKMLSIGELFSANQIQNLNDEEISNQCVGDFECGESTNATVLGVVVKGIVISKGPQVPSDWPVLEGDYVAVANYSTAFQKNHYVSVNYKSIPNKFNNEFPVALLDGVSVQIFSINETIESSKSDLLHLPGYEQSVDGSAKGIVLSVGAKVPGKVATDLGSGGVFVVSGLRSVFSKRYSTTVNYRSIRTKYST